MLLTLPGLQSSNRLILWLLLWGSCQTSLFKGCLIHILWRPQVYRSRSCYMTYLNLSITRCVGQISCKSIIVLPKVDRWNLLKDDLEMDNWQRRAQLNMNVQYIVTAGAWIIYINTSQRPSFIVIWNPGRHTSSAFMEAKWWPFSFSKPVHCNFRILDT